MNWLPKRSLVVPVDFSDESIAALETARSLVDNDADLHVVYVLPELSPVEPGELWDTVNHETRTQHAQEALHKKLDEVGLGGATAIVRFGDAGGQIAAYAESEKAELIVLPSHGRTGIKRWLIGSVAERVVRLASCPVLVLRS